MQRKIALFVLLILFFPATLFAVNSIKTGYDLYRFLKLEDDYDDENMPKIEDMMLGMEAMGYLEGYGHSLLLVQQILFVNVLGRVPEKERPKVAKQINFLRVNTPESGFNTEILVLIYKRWAEKYPEKLHQKKAMCVFEALLDAYGWK